MPPTRTELGKYDGDIVGAASPCAPSRSPCLPPTRCRDRARARDRASRSSRWSSSRRPRRRRPRRPRTHPTSRETAPVPERTRTYHRARPRCGAGARNAPNACERDCIVKTVLGCDRAGSGGTDVSETRQLVCVSFDIIMIRRPIAHHPRTLHPRAWTTTDAGLLRLQAQGRPPRDGPRVPRPGRLPARALQAGGAASARARVFTPARDDFGACVLSAPPAYPPAPAPAPSAPRWDPDPPRAATTAPLPTVVPPRAAPPPPAPIPSAPLRHVLGLDATRVGWLAAPDANKVQDYTKRREVIHTGHMLDARGDRAGVICDITPHAIDPAEGLLFPAKPRSDRT